MINIGEIHALLDEIKLAITEQQTSDGQVLFDADKIYILLLTVKRALEN